MARTHEIKFSKTQVDTDLTYLVHRPASWLNSLKLGARTWQNAAKFFPPRPRAVPNMGFPYLTVVDNKANYVFTSGAEIDHFVEVFSQKILPTSRQLAEKHGVLTVNRTWLSRVKKAKFSSRLSLVSYLQNNDQEFRRLVASLT